MKTKLVTLLLSLCMLFGITGIVACKTIQNAPNETSLGDLTFRLSYDESYYSVTSLNKNAKTVVIPSVCENLPVTSIEEFAFRSCSSLTSISIPESVNFIGRGAFYNCSALESVTLPENIAFIGDYTFEGCKNLASIIIPDNVSFIGWSAFSGCGSLTSITFSSNSCLSAIKHEAFEDCSSLTTIDFPDSVTSIENYVFSGCSNLTSVTIGRNVAFIAENAFYACRKLVEVINKSSLRIIKGGTSYGHIASHAKQVITNESDSKIIKQGEYIFYKDNDVYYLVAYTGKDAELIFVDNIDGNAYTINPYAFYYSSNLTSITFSENSQLTSIGEWAFSGCENLISVTIPKSATSIGERAFSGCDNLMSITFNKNGHLTSIGSSAFFDCSSLTSITVPDSVTIIGSSAFCNCSNLRSIAIGSGVASIGGSVFSNCDDLIEIIIDENNKYYQSIDGNLYSKNGEILIKYAKGKTATQFIIPNGVTSIGESGFSNCSSLIKIIIPDSVTYIGVSAFRSCNALISITLPDNITFIGHFAFSDCTSLINVKFENPNGWGASSTVFLAKDLLNTSTAASYLRDMYAWYTWTRTDSRCFEY